MFASRRRRRRGGARCADAPRWPLGASSARGFVPFREGSVGGVQPMRRAGAAAPIRQTQTVRIAEPMALHSPGSRGSHP